jgi:hypothetical protein
MKEYFGRKRMIKWWFRRFVTLSFIFFCFVPLVHALDFDPKLSCPSGYEPDGELSTRDISTGLVEAHQSCIRLDFSRYIPEAEKAVNDQLTDQAAQAVGYPNADIVKRLGPRFESGYRELLDRSCAAGYTEGTYSAEIPPYWSARGGDVILSKYPEGIVDKMLGTIGQTYSHAGLALGRFGVSNLTVISCTNLAKKIKEF